MYAPQEFFFPVEHFCWNQSNQKYQIQNVMALEIYQNGI